MNPTPDVNQQMELHRIGDTFRRLLETLVDDPDALKTQLRIEETGATTLRVYVSKSDAGKLIGRQGKNSRAIRLLLQAAGAKAKRSIALDIQTLDSPESLVQ